MDIRTGAGRSSLGREASTGGMEIGIVVCGPSLGGKWETKGVFGGGSDSENSAAREES